MSGSMPDEDTPDGGDTKGKTSAHGSLLKLILGFRPTAAELAFSVGLDVRGQDEAVRTVCLALRRHMTKLRDDPSGRWEAATRETVLLMGPTGCGKSRICSTLTHLTFLPHVYFDLNSLTEVGYVGASVDDIITNLIADAGGDASLAQLGAIFLDECDKLQRKESGTLDPTRSGAQQSLLSLLDGAPVQYCEGGRDRGRSYKTFRTDRLFVVLAGAFAGIEQIIERRVRGRRSLGFGIAYEAAKDRQAAAAELLQQVTHDDLIVYGLLPELVGRIQTIVPIRQLDRADLLNILTARSGPISGTQRWARLEGVELRVTTRLLEGIAQEAEQSGLGARSLHGIVSRVVRRAMYEVTADRASRDRQPRVVLDVDALRDGSYKVTFPAVPRATRTRGGKATRVDDAAEGEDEAAAETI